MFVCKCVLYYCHRLATQLQLTDISYHIISYHVLFVCKCALYYCHRVATQLQLTNIPYHIISYHIISYHIISYHIISYHIISYHIISYRNHWNENGKFSLSRSWRHTGGENVWLHPFFTSAIDGDEWLNSRPGRFTPGKKAVTPWTRDLCTKHFTSRRSVFPLSWSYWKTN